MNKNQGKLRIFIYSKNALDDLKYICKNIDFNLNKDKQFNKEIYVTNDKTFNYEYFIVPGEINEEKNRIIEHYLIEHYKEENMAKANKEIEEIITKNTKRLSLKGMYDEDSYDEDSSDKAFNLYNESVSQEISKILLKYRKFYDILVICVDELLGKDSESAFKFFQGFTKTIGQQPFIFFLTKKDDNPDITNLFKFITNEFFDKRNVFAYKYPSNDEEIEKINNYFIKCMNYYHEVGNIDINFISQTFNILICGKAGVGKSSFINQFLNGKIAKEGEGLSVTQEITNYRHPKYKIKIFDTPGFENDNTVEKVYRTIKKFEKDIRDSKNHLDLIMYFNELTPRTFYALEMKLLKHLIKQKKKIIFVLNDKSKNTKSERNRLIGVFKDSIKKIVNTMENKNEIEIDDILKNIVVINLKQHIEEVEDDDEENNNKIILKPTFGMDELFNKIYEMLKDHKISFYEIDKAKDVSEIMEKIKKYDLLKHIKNIEDVHINIKINCAKLILSYAKYDFFVWFYIDRRRKELLEKINAINKGNEINDIELLLINLKKKVDKLSDKNETARQFFDGIKKFKGLFETEGFNFDAFFYNEYTLLLGSEYFKQFQNDYGEYDEKSKEFLRDLCNTFNDAIDDFKKLSEEWKETYQALKLHKTDKEWIKKFFIVEIPKKIE